MAFDTRIRLWYVLARAAYHADLIHGCAGTVSLPVSSGWGVGVETLARGRHLAWRGGVRR